MLNEVHCPKGGLIPVQSTWEPATTKAIEAGYKEAKRLASTKSREKQHRNFSVYPDGRSNHTTVAICTGGNAAWRWCLRKAVMESGVYGFVYPGDPDGVNQQTPDQYRINYHYKDDDKDSIGHRWLRFLLDTQNSPWRHVLRNVVDLDPDKAYAERAVLFQHLDVMPFYILQLFMMAGRWMIEAPRKIGLWNALVEDGIRPQSAFLLATQFCKMQTAEAERGSYTAVFPHAHEAIVSNSSALRMFRDGVYQTANPPLVAGGQCIRPVNQLQPDRKMSMGWVKIDPEEDKYQVIYNGKFRKAMANAMGTPYKEILEFAGWVDGLPPYPQSETNLEAIPSHPWTPATERTARQATQRYTRIEDEGHRPEDDDD